MRIAEATCYDNFLVLPCGHMKQIMTHFSALPARVKSMLYLHWIYSFVGILTGTFVQIYLYQRFESVTFNIIAQIIWFIGCALGFSLIGAIVSWCRWNIKWGYLWAFIFSALSFPILFGEVSTYSALIFMFINGIGLGLYWLTLHTFELTETRNHERDYYSSVLSAGDQIVSLCAPAFATLLFYLSEVVLHWDTFTLLFLVAPLIYISGIPFFRTIPAYRPRPIDWHDLRHFLSDRRNRHAQVYLFASSAHFGLISVALPIATFIMLGDAKEVGVYSTIFAVLSVFALLILSRYRHAGSRMQFLFWTSIASAFTTLVMVVRFDFAGFIVFSLLSVILNPLSRVSAHVIDLDTMETLAPKGKDFFPTMIFRDVAFGIWRVLALIAFLWLTRMVGEGETAVRVSFVAIAISSALLWVGARLIYQKAE